LPCWFGQNASKNVGKIKKRSCKKNLLHRLVLSLHYNEPHNNGTKRDRDVLGKAKQLQTACNACKFRKNVAEVHYQDAQHHKKGDAQTKFFTNQIAQP